MAHREIVICSPVRTAIGTYGGTLKDTSAPDLGAVVVRTVLERAKLPPGDVGTVVMGNVVPGRQQDEPRPAGGDQRRSAGRCAGDDRESSLRLGRSSDCERGAGGDAWLHRQRACWRHGEHGSGALSHEFRALGLPHG